MEIICRKLPVWRTFTCIRNDCLKRNFYNTGIQILQSSSSHHNAGEKTIPISMQNPIKNSNSFSSSRNMGTQESVQQSSSSSNNTTTFSEEEVSKFRKLAGEWWKPDGEFKLLHSMNKLRVPLVRDGLIETGVPDAAYKDGPRPLQGVRILDVGCGGGILAEPLARLGAVVTGLDAAEEGIEAAKLHASKNPKLSGNLSYTCGRIEDHVSELNEPYDAIVASEVLEHVSSLDCFLDACSTGIKPGGSLFVTTINRTTKSYLGAILAAEYVMRYVPRGTHDWNKFIDPQELKKMLQQRGFRTQLLHGMVFFPPTNTWCWSRDSSINYAMHAIKLR